jgi:hypothetical protein
VNTGQPVHFLRDAISRSQAVREYRIRYDTFYDAEELQTLLGNADEAADAHDIALLFVRAYRAEQDDDEPAKIAVPIEDRLAAIAGAERIMAEVRR